MHIPLSLRLTVYHLLLLILALAIGQPVSLQAQDPPEYTVYQSGTPVEIDGQLDEPAWTGAPGVGAFVFPWYESGQKEQTVAKLLWDDTYLYVAFICEDEYIWAEHTQRDSAVYSDDAVEVFTAPNPDRAQAYFNIEMNVLGIFLDNFQSGQPAANGRANWDGQGIRIKTTIKGTLNNDSDRDEYWILEAAIPFKNFAQVARHTPPEKEDVWHLNLNRLGGNSNQQFSQWSPSQTNKPDFHVPEDFGRVIFSDKTSPFER
ncbi:Carbohydrate family 9 binding domain-like [Fodinibius roseus]|uniref:Carbohydrate family 9 binding domain-like n=1 Tax=Fodinibius roseus TaxID=1194090 RepID=A0A1M5HXN9_9BACT|nr:carbohydrate-binding family 9-like protein [Fodinibius roseus]SHG20649.1 Carbohydrate family 9 binding domain-like [Fodinibius roseus]